MIPRSCLCWTVYIITISSRIAVPSTSKYNCHLFSTASVIIEVPNKQCDYLHKSSIKDYNGCRDSDCYRIQDSTFYNSFYGMVWYVLCYRGVPYTPEHQNILGLNTKTPELVRFLGRPWRMFNQGHIFSTLEHKILTSTRLCYQSQNLK